MSTIQQTPLKGIPFASPKKNQPVHIKLQPEDLKSAAADDYTQTKGLDIGFSSEETNKGWLSSLFSGGPDASTAAAANPQANREPASFKLGQASLAGHFADDANHGHYPNSRHEIRTYMPVEGGRVASVSFQDLLQAVKIPSVPSQHFVVSQKQVQDAVNSTGAEREEQLHDLSKLKQGDRVVPKDATLNPTDVTMFLRSTGDVSTRYAQQMSRIGEIEGFHVVAGISDGSARSFKSALDGYNNVSLMEIPHGEVWVEDYSEPTLTGGQVTPAIFSDSRGRLVSEAIADGREKRFRGTGLDGAFAYHGAVNQGKYQDAALARGIANQGPLRQALSYMEGGNIYTGTRANGEGYVLVGRDSMAVTQALLEEQTGRKWTESEVSKVIAADMGLKPDGVVPVEQPGAFHLDMRMTAIAPGEIVLNDSKAAAEQQIQWMKQAVEKQVASGSISDYDAKSKLRQIDDMARGMRQQAEKMAPYEELSAQDLRKAGFTVHRMAGSFVDPQKPTRDTANYFNARHGTNENGERFSVLMGGQTHEEAYVAQQLFELGGADLSRIHFLDPKVTQSTLDLMGGLKCRTKPEGDLVSQNLIENPAQAQLISA